MIGKNVINGKRTYTCDECQKVVGYYKSYRAAGESGWAISRDRKKCYCPNCAPKKRHVGRSPDKLRKIQ